MNLFTRKRGDGPPLIILHGLYGSSDNWLTIAGMLADSYTVYLPDQRNHGRSPHSSIHDYMAMAEDLHRLSESIHPGGKCIIAGHSMGGKTAMTYALNYPEKVEALIVADISPFSNEPHDSRAARFHRKILELMVETEREGIASRAEAESRIDEVVREQRIASFIMKNLHRTAEGEYRWRINAEALLENLQVIMESIPGLDRSTAPVTGFPVLFIRGGNSDYLPQKHLDDALKLFPAASTVTIEGAGHWLHAEKPQQFVEAIREFLY